MKKKVVNGLLILGVSIIWVFVLKRALNMLGDKDMEYVAVPSVITTNDIPEFDKDTFNLAVFKRDPFLDKLKFEKKIINRKENSKPQKTSKKTFAKKKVESRITWPKLKYFGYMKGSDNKGELALIKINNKLQRVRAKESVNEIYVQSVFADSVVIRIGKNTKTVHK